MKNFLAILLLLFLSALLCLDSNANALVEECILDDPVCETRGNRDLMFVVDGSDSLDRERYFNEMMDYMIRLYCAFHPDDVIRVGMIGFQKTVQVLIPLQERTKEQWIVIVNQLRAQNNTCCGCCTPTAEAIALAKTTLISDGRPNDPDVSQIAFVISDGKPFQNPNGKYAFPEMSYADYLFKAVPNEATGLKNNEIRLAFVGVPNKENVPPLTFYFAGVPEPELAPAGKPTTQCVTRGNHKSCGVMSKDKFPIVSDPVEFNLFSSNTWDVRSLLDQTVDAICQLVFTDAPTFAPTTKTPTGKPTTRAPTGKPTTSAPTLKPTTKQPTKAPTQKPTFSPTNSPTTSPTKSPTKKPTRSPTRKPTQSPTKSPTKRPTQSPTQKPTQSPTKSPTTRRPTPKPTFYNLNQMDLYILVDTSASMLDFNSICASVIVRDPEIELEEKSASKCWQLFLSFMLKMGKEASLLGLTGPMGWVGDMEDESLGLRVSITGFACNAAQKVPVVHDILPRADTFRQLFNGLNRAAKEYYPVGGTCPSASIDLVVSRIAQSDRSLRPNIVSLLITDGIFFDSKFTDVSQQGLTHYQIPTFAVGIGISKQGHRLGLTPAGIEIQKKNLLNFARGVSANVFNLGDDGFSLLEEVTTRISTTLNKMQLKPDNVDFGPTCTYTTLSGCLFSNGDDEDICRWFGFERRCIAVTQCLDKIEKQCKKDKYCKWSGKKTHTCLPLGQSNQAGGVDNPTKQPTKKPTASTSCSWGDFISSTGGLEATPDDRCSDKINAFGCSGKNFCCFNFDEGICSVPIICGDNECQDFEDQDSCENQGRACCTWNEDKCQRKCPGNVEEICG